MQFIGSALKVHGEDESHQAKVMITVQVTDENVIDAMEVYLKTHELHLGTFAAINEKNTILNFDQL